MSAISPEFSSASVALPSECLYLNEPKLFKGLVDSWPVVREFAGKSATKLPEYLMGFYQGAPLTVYEAGPEAKARLFYNDEFTGFNFSRHRRQMPDVLKCIEQSRHSSDPKLLYVGSTMIKHWLPGFEQQNVLDLGERDSLNSIWFGNRCLIAPHFDFPDNLALVVGGRRKFRLYPPDQVDNLYIGPFDITPSGQPISLVDVRSPDYERFPNYKLAQDSCLEFVLEPGDALFIPSMWWHSVESLDDFNVLVNYWWRSTPAYLGSPLAAFQHALLSFDGLSQEQKLIWQSLFTQFVFERSDDSIAHIPEGIKGLYAGVDERMAIKLRRGLSDALKA